MHVHVSVHTVTLNAQIVREEKCEACFAEFVYGMTCVGSGAMISPLPADLLGESEIAQSIAGSSLSWKMKHARELVRCPACMKFQRSLIRAKRFNLTLKTLVLGALPAFLAFLMMSISFSSISYQQHRLVTSVVFVAVLILVFLTAVLFPRLYDPNLGRFFPLGPGTNVVGMPREAWLVEKARRREVLGIQPQEQNLEGPDTRTPEQRRADAQARRDAEMGRIARQANTRP